MVVGGGGDSAFERRKGKKGEFLGVVSVCMCIYILAEFGNGNAGTVGAVACLNTDRERDR